MNNRLLITLLTASMLFSGGSAIINEYILSSVASTILGNSFEQYSLTIGTMLFAMGIGGFIQKSFSNKHLMAKFATVELTLALIGSFAPLCMYAAFAYLPHIYSIFNYLFIFMIGFLVGFEIPLLIRITEQYANKGNSNDDSLKRSLARIFSADYIGVFIGSLLWVYFLLTVVPFTEASFLSSGANFIVALITFTYFAVKQNQKNPLFFIAALIVGLSMLYGYMNNRTWNVNLEQKLFKDPIIFKTTTKYQHLVVTHNKRFNDTRLYINGNTQFSSTDEVRYHDFLVHGPMSMAKRRENVLVLGGGDGLAIREIKKYKDVKNITIVDLDKKMIEFAKTNEIMKRLNNNAFENVNIADHQSVLETGKIDIYRNDKKGEEHKLAQVNSYHVDAGKFLHEIRNVKWDIIIIDLPDPSTIELVKLYSKEFYMTLKKVMHKGTMLIIQSTSPYYAKESFLMIGRTLKAAGINNLPFRFNIPSFGEWGWHLGWGSEMPESFMRSKIDNLDNFLVETDYLTPGLFKSAFMFGKGELDSEDKRINSWMQPSLLEVYVDNKWLGY